jgi:hypothetical protein
MGNVINVSAVPRRGPFWIATAIAAVPQLAAIYVLASAPSVFVVWVALWNIAPLVVALILFAGGARYAAWGWLIGVTLLGWWNVGAALMSHSSTVGLVFLWTPVWNFALTGPIGAGIVMLARKLYPD